MTRFVSLINKIEDEFLNSKENSNYRSQNGFLKIVIVTIDILLNFKIMTQWKIDFVSEQLKDDKIINMNKALETLSLGTRLLSE